MRSLVPKILNILSTTKLIDQETNKTTGLVLNTLHILLENCPDALDIHAENIANVLLNFNNFENCSLRFKVGRCWISIIKLRKDIFNQFCETLFDFFTDNLSKEAYEMNFTAAEFYLFVIEEDDGAYLKNAKVYHNIQKNFHT